MGARACAAKAGALAERAAKAETGAAALATTDSSLAALHTATRRAAAGLTACGSERVSEVRNQVWLRLARRADAPRRAALHG